ncbi:MAG: ATP-binding protein [Myxococcota bacterium]
MESAASPQGAFYDGVRMIFETIRQDELLPRMVQAVQTVLGASTASLILPNPQGQLYVAFTSVQTEEGGAPNRVIISDGVAVRVAQRRKPALITGTRDDDEWLEGLTRRRRGGSSVVFPVLRDEVVLGVLSANRDAGLPPFSRGDVEQMSVFAGFARLALENMRLFNSLEETHQKLQRSMAEQARIEADLRLSQKLEAVGQLAAGIAHEINTPVQYVGDTAHFLRTAFDDIRTVLDAYREGLARLRAGISAEEVGQWVTQAEDTADLQYLLTEIPRAFDRIFDGTSRVATIVRAMKEFAHPDSREMQPADLNKALTTTVTIARNEYKEVADVRMELGELPPVLCHVGDLNQAFLNLIVNAAHAIQDAHPGPDQRGVIRVATRVAGDTVIISISDTGCGIPAQIRDRIFDPFFTTKEVGRGTGQGLTLVRRVVDRHHGKITLETEVGRGTSFHLHLPIAGAPQEQDAAA